MTLVYRDILSSAKLIREIHGEDAEEHADKMIADAIDDDMRKVWMAIKNELRRFERPTVQ